MRPKTRFGQNFLIDLNLHELLVQSAQLDQRDVVLEVGAGTGAITSLIAPRAAEVVTVEVDYQLATLAMRELEAFSNVLLMRQDALRNKNHIDDAVMDAVRQRLAAAPDRRFKLVANLPYNIATPLLSNLLLENPPPCLMVATIQKELADRLVAQPSTKDYGSLSVWVQSQANVEIVRVLPPQVFWPRPLVHSAIVAIEPRDDLRSQIPDLGFFHKFCRMVFMHRRKFLRSVLVSGTKGVLDKPRVDEILSQVDLLGEIRAEALNLEELARLCEALRIAIQRENGSGAESLLESDDGEQHGLTDTESAREEPT